MHMGSNPTCGDNNTSFGSWNIIGCCEMAWLRRIDVCTKEVVAAFYNSACGAAHLDTEQPPQVQVMMALSGPVIPCLRRWVDTALVVPSRHIPQGVPHNSHSYTTSG
ncbi:hypothetical protein CY34DRAFT_751738 [Suillus luteus UH-Slu-Lm8-n1]|uniref:Uncharacterized protein n=1 Tax=Suillus luteus UH-Slu-Lm8-n1 TaxID=930992 RepID=A0A0C9ZYR5_9AGAM|nr:hypothetical protein CY34DRAFT_751738 [Suillus luteus UH-Slu-Lm8-n1]